MIEIRTQSKFEAALAKPRAVGAVVRCAKGMAI